MHISNSFFESLLTSSNRIRSHIAATAITEAVAAMAGGVTIDGVTMVDMMIDAVMTIGATIVEDAMTGMVTGRATLRLAGDELQQ